MDAEVRSVADGEMSLVPVAVTLNSSCLGFFCPQHGYELMKELSPSRWLSPSPGSVYPTLQMLEEAVI